ncbi:MAG: hypothetical protein HW400_597 [Candidatus Levybacteria bacterium]|nr:hypothetical protein [Candidatus Levybacteria bacterium]
MRNIIESKDFRRKVVAPTLVTLATLLALSTATVAVGCDNNKGKTGNVGAVTLNSENTTLGPISDASIAKGISESFNAGVQSQKDAVAKAEAEKEAIANAEKKAIEAAKRKLIAEAQKRMDEKSFPKEKPAFTQREIALPIRNAHVNEVEVDLSSFKEGDNPHELYYNATGINTGKNYKLNLPEGWSAITASLSAEIHREGREPVVNTNSPEMIIVGPFEGGAGLWEGAIYIVPTRWLNTVSERVLATQRQQTGKPNLPITFFDK